MRPAPARVVGLDYSLTSTGVATTHPHKATLIRPRTKGHARLEELKTSVTALVRQARPALVVIESGSYASTSSTFHQLAGGWWLVAHEIYRLGVPYATVAPGTLKRYATGSGTADKDTMVAAARAAWPNVLVTNDDAADALWLADMGSHYLGRPLTTSRAPDALEAVSWPRVGAKPATPSAKERAAARKKTGRTKTRTPRSRTRT